MIISIPLRGGQHACLYLFRVNSRVQADHKDVAMRLHGRACDTCVCIYMPAFLRGVCHDIPVPLAPPLIPPPASHVPSLRGVGGPGVSAAAVTVCYHHNATAHSNMVLVLQRRFFPTHISPEPVTHARTVTFNTDNENESQPEAAVSFKRDRSLRLGFSLPDQGPQAFEVTTRSVRMTFVQASRRASIVNIYSPDTQVETNTTTMIR